MPIQILPPRLANQIAAGEVVERPASVVKELVENSLDAGASRVDIEIEKGGHRLIRIRDNGCGITKSELALALSRHATSKITHLDDLEAIQTLGFRGEALASISSVSRLTLTSRTADQPEAWMAYAEGRDMQVALKPAAHPVGTTLEVAELFFNTPARRKFLRAEKTEFQHIEQLLKRIALTRYQVAFSLTHNGRVVHRWPACRDQAAEQRRLAQICGQAFIGKALRLEQDYDAVQLRGWLMASDPLMAPDPHQKQSHSVTQHCFINGRMIRDKLLTHAMRQAYSEFITDAAQASYVIYLTLPASELDVNVHPTKHEVRFTQARLIHDFLVQAVQDRLRQQLETEVDPQTGECPPPNHPPSNHPPPNQPVEPPASHVKPDYATAAPLGSYQHYVRERSPSAKQLSGYHSLLGQTTEIQPPPEPVIDSATSPISKAADSLRLQQGNTLFVAPHYLLCSADSQLWCLDLCREQAAYWQQLFDEQGQIIRQPLLLPTAIKAEPELLAELQNCVERAQQVGIDFAMPRPDKLILRQLPPFLRQTPLSDKLGPLQAALQADKVSETIQLLVALSAEHTDWARLVPEVLQRRHSLTTSSWCRPYHPELSALFH